MGNFIDESIPEAPLVGEAPADIQAEIEQDFGKISYDNDVQTSRIKLSTEQLEIAIPWYLAKTVGVGEWYLDQNENTSVYSPLMDEVGASRLPVEKAVKSTVENGILEKALTKISGNLVIGNVRATELGSDMAEKVAKDQPEEMRIIETAIVEHRVQTARLVWRETNIARSQLGEDHKPLALSEGAALVAVNACIEELVAEQTELLSVLDPSIEPPYARAA